MILAVCVCVCVFQVWIMCVRWSESLIEFLSVIDLSTGSAALVSEVTSSHRRVVAHLSVHECV